MTAPPAAARVAVVIVNYQSYAELRDCLASLGLPADDVRCVVVDNLSQPAAADALASAFPHIDVVRNTANDGFAAAVNRGVRHAPSEYVLLLNPDSMASLETCRMLAAWMDANAHVGAVGPRIRNTDGTIQASARRFPDFTTGIAGRSSWLTRVLPRNPLTHRNLSPAGQETAAPVDWVSGACMMVRRTAFESVGGMDEGFFLYWEDADLCRRLHTNGWQVAYNPVVSVVHAGGRSSRHAADASLVAFHQSAYRLYRKHASRPGRILAPFVYAALRLRLAVIRRVVRRRENRRIAQAR